MRIRHYILIVIVLAPLLGGCNWFKKKPIQPDLYGNYAIFDAGEPLVLSGAGNIFTQPDGSNRLEIYGDTATWGSSPLVSLWFYSSPASEKLPVGEFSYHADNDKYSPAKNFFDASVTGVALTSRPDGLVVIEAAGGGRYEINIDLKFHNPERVVKVHYAGLVKDSLESRPALTSADFDANTPRNADFEFSYDPKAYFLSSLEADVPYTITGCTLTQDPSGKGYTLRFVDTGASAKAGDSAYVAFTFAVESSGGMPAEGTFTYNPQFWGERRAMRNRSFNALNNFTQGEARTSGGASPAQGGTITVKKLGQGYCRFDFEQYRLDSNITGSYEGKVVATSGRSVALHTEE